MITHDLYYLGAGDIQNLSAGIDSGYDLTVQNVNSFPIYLGGSDNLNSENYGYRLDAGASFSIELSGQDDLFVNTDNNGTYVAVLRAHLEIGK
jgi:hypothetical protein